MSGHLEDVFFYLDLSKELLKKKDIKKAIQSYIEEKNKTNDLGLYGLFLFQKDGNPVFITNKKDPEVLLNAIEENWKNRASEQSYFENGLFYIFSYIAETIREQSKFNRVIVITDTPSDLNEEYQEALFNLVAKIRLFPTFVDIIRVSEENQRFFKDDVKLNMLARDTKGGIFYIHNKNEFLGTMKKLIKHKQLVSTFAHKPDKIEITKEDYIFYSKLAKKLQPIEPLEDADCFFCHEAVCPICEKVEDIPLICPNCRTSFHNCCIINYAIHHNIGIPNIFRCPNPNCDVLLQVRAEEFMELSDKPSTATSISEYLEEDFGGSGAPGETGATFQSNNVIKDEKTVSSEVGPKILNVENRREETVKEEVIQERQVRIGGFFGPVFKVKKMGNKIIYERADKTLNNRSKNMGGISSTRSTYWSPSSDKNTEQR
ncbi:MAG: hypothetical protein ACTSYC_11540, partial [Promethearchaeota archaeon]